MLLNIYSFMCLSAQTFEFRMNGEKVEEGATVTFNGTKHIIKPQYEYKTKDILSLHNLTANDIKYSAEIVVLENTMEAFGVQICMGGQCNVFDGNTFKFVAIEALPANGNAATLFDASSKLTSGHMLTKLTVTAGLESHSVMIRFEYSDLVDATVMIGNLWYNLNPTLNIATVVKNNGEGDGNGYNGDIVIPSDVDYEGTNYVVKSIADEAFYENVGIFSITIGRNVTKIGRFAFASCAKLTSVYCHAEEIPETDETVFENSYPKYITLYVPTSSIEKYKAVSPWNSFAKIKSIDETIAELYTIIGNGGNIRIGETVLDNESKIVYLEKEKPTEIVIKPNSDYAIDKVTLDGEDITTQVSAEGKLSLTLTADAELVVTFKFVATSCEINITNTMATFCSAYDLDFSNVEGLKAYIASGFNKATNTVLMSRVYDVPAGTGLLLMGETGAYHVDYSTSTSWYTNLLKGVTTATTITSTSDGYNNYILANGSHGIGFYPVSGEGTLAAGKAYLQLPSSVSSAKGFSLSFEDETTGIEENYEFGNMNYDNTVYDLQGRKVKNPTKGLYIVNSKKVVVK